MVKRQKVEEEVGVHGGGPSARTSTSALFEEEKEGEGAADALLRDLRQGFDDLRDLCERNFEDDGRASAPSHSYSQPTEDAERHWVDVGVRLKESLNALIRHRSKQAKGSVGRREQGGRDRALIADDLLKNLFDKLQECMITLGQKLDLMKSVQLDFLEDYSTSPTKLNCSGGWKDLISYSHKLGFTTFAPPTYIHGDPRWGTVGGQLGVGQATGHIHNSAPYPQKWHVDASVLYDYARDVAPPKEKSEEDRMEIDRKQDKEEQPLQHKQQDQQLHGQHQTLVKKEEEKVDNADHSNAVAKAKERNTQNAWVDFVLNPELQELASEEEFSESSD